MNKKITLVISDNPEKLHNPQLLVESDATTPDVASCTIRTLHNNIDTIIDELESAIQYLCELPTTNLTSNSNEN